MRAEFLIKLAASAAVSAVAATLLFGTVERYLAARIEKQQTVVQHQWAGRQREMNFHELEASELQLRRAVRFVPDNQHLFLLLGNVHMLQGQWQESIHDFSRALDARKDPRTLLNLSEAYRLKGDRSQALRCIREALSYDRNDPAAQLYGREALKRLEANTPVPSTPQPHN